MTHDWNTCAHCATCKYAEVENTYRRVVGHVEQSVTPLWCNKAMAYVERIDIPNSCKHYKYARPYDSCNGFSPDTYKEHNGYLYGRFTGYDTRKTMLSELGLTNNVRKSLQRNGVYDVEKLQLYSEKQLMSFRGFGVKALDDLKNCCSQHNVYLKGQVIGADV